MQKYLFSITPILALWAAMMIIVPLFDLFDVQVLRAIMQVVVISCGVFCGLAALYIVARIVLVIFGSAGQRHVKKEILASTVARLRPVQTLIWRTWLFLVLFIGVSFSAMYLGRLIAGAA